MNSLRKTLAVAPLAVINFISVMGLTPWAAHKHYGKRATSENWIELENSILSMTIT